MIVPHILYPRVVLTYIYLYESINDIDVCVFYFSFLLIGGFWDYQAHLPISALAEFQCATRIQTSVKSKAHHELRDTSCSAESVTPNNGDIVVMDGE